MAACETNWGEKCLLLINRLFYLLTRPRCRPAPPPHGSNGQQLRHTGGNRLMSWLRSKQATTSAAFNLYIWPFWQWSLRPAWTQDWQFGGVQILSGGHSRYCLKSIPSMYCNAITIGVKLLTRRLWPNKQLFYWLMCPGVLRELHRHGVKFSCALGLILRKP